MGVDVLKGILIDDSLGVCGQLEERMQETVDAYKDPWREADGPVYEQQFEGPRLVEVIGDVNNNG
jgi:nitrite reductase (NADH) large subunit